MDLLQETKYLLRTHRIRPNKLLGQNFMIEQSIFPLMADYASLNRDDTVLDIGAGLGFLTRFLAKICKMVLAIEIDAELSRVLREQLINVPNVKVIQANVLEAEIPSFNKIVSIPPYCISSRLLTWLFRKRVDVAVMVVQKEFANRLVASVGTEDYGWLTVLAYYYMNVELLEEFSKSMFYPEPQVDSIVVRLTPRKSKPFKVADEASFQKILQLLFAQRNRKVENTVVPYLKGVRGLSKKDARRVGAKIPFRDQRVRRLTPEDFGALANVLNNEESIL